MEMKMKNVKILLGMLGLVLLFGIASIGCDGEKPDEKNTFFTVIFNVGGFEPAPQPQTVIAGSKLTQPTAPSLLDSTFSGWIWEINTDTWDSWNFDTDTVEKNIILYAMFTVIDLPFEGTWKNINENGTEEIWTFKDNTYIWIHNGNIYAKGTFVYTNDNLTVFNDGLFCLDAWYSFNMDYTFDGRKLILSGRTYYFVPNVN